MSDLEPDARQLIRLARGDAPPAGDKERLRALLAARIEAPPPPDPPREPPAPGPAPLAATSAAGQLAPLLKVGVGAFLLAGGALSLSSLPSREPTPPPAVATARVVATATSAPASAAPAAASAPASAAPAAVTPLASAARAGAIPPAAPATAAATAAPRIEAEATGASVSPSAGAMLPQMPPGQAGIFPTSAGASTPVGADAADPLQQEIALLAQARSALSRGETAAAHEALKEHQQRFPASAMAHERSMLSLLVACRAGQADAVRPQVRAFLAKNPRSPYAPALRAACNEPEAP